VGGVSDQDDPTAAPRGKRLEVVNVVAEDLRLVGGLEELADRVVPG
jgi:hypothetical protein